MSNIINFPRLTKPPHPEPVGQPQANAPPPALPEQQVRGFVAALIRFVWVVTVLVWPILKWLAAFEVFFQFVRMLYHWNTPGVYAGWAFLMHFGALTALTYFVSVYKPKGI